MVVIRAATRKDFDSVVTLLNEVQLHTADLHNDLQNFFVAMENNNLIGVAGVELYGEYALLRSVAVAASHRDRGMAKDLVHKLYKYSVEKMVKTIYLITTTAEKYFARLGFTTVDRASVPVLIGSTAEFTTLCPSTAVVMARQVNETDMMKRKKLLFVCVENSNRSQMAEAFARIHGGELVAAYSAGSKPVGIVNPKAIAAMQVLGYDLHLHDSKSLNEVTAFAPFDAVVTMGCGDACPWMPAEKFIDWQIPDPRNMDAKDFNNVRDLIEEKVKELLKTI